MIALHVLNQNDPPPSDDGFRCIDLGIAIDTQTFHRVQSPSN